MAAKPDPALAVFLSLSAAEATARRLLHALAAARIAEARHAAFSLVDNESMQNRGGWSLPG